MNSSQLVHQHYRSKPLCPRQNRLMGGREREQGRVWGGADAGLDSPLGLPRGSVGVAGGLLARIRRRRVSLEEAGGTGAGCCAGQKVSNW